MPGACWISQCRPGRDWPHLFRSADPVIGVRRAKFLVLLEPAVTESLASDADDDLRGVDELAPFWVQALRIGAVDNQERILQAITHRREFPAYITGQESRYLCRLSAGRVKPVTHRSCFL